MFSLSTFCVRFIHDGSIALVVLLGPIASAMFTCLEVTGDLERNQKSRGPDYFADNLMRVVML